ncbi:hypothetical protein DMN91_007412 [Ooceraea biroi]|uniref:Uncharacterized protein n=1 Tax=Ooceraea biroi TaxID=2015173 RepID=A0A3L8DLU3_OOCBI|nr:hypothetical protein DMN91_007412 [Ooceraea biroi]
MLEEVCSVMEQEHLEHRAKFTVPLRVENQEVIFDVDCGSAVTLLKILAKVKNSLVEIEDVKMLDACGQKRLAKLLEKYRNVLSEEFAHIKNFKAHLKLKPDAKPTFIKNRVVPFKIVEKVEKELDRMVKAGILEKVESSRWATPIVPVLKKDGGIRSIFRIPLDSGDNISKCTLTAPVLLPNTVIFSGSPPNT